MVSLAMSWKLLKEFNLKPSTLKSIDATIRHFSAVSPIPAARDTKSDGSNQERKTIIPEKCRFMYPEFLPDPKMIWRNPIREKLERKDMLARRARVNIPEFYVGSILAVTSSTKHAANKKNRFVGICIDRDGTGLRSWFQLRNIIDNIGIEIRYNMYDPTVEKIEVLRLEKRLDNHLRYLKDALPEYSTFPLDMEAEFLPEDQPVPLNTIKVKLKPRPWSARWERKELKGLADLNLPQRFYDAAEKTFKPWEKYDLMKQYRSTIPEEEQKEIYAEVYSELHQLDLSQKRFRRMQDSSKSKAKS